MISVVTITFNNYEELIQTVKSVEGLPIEHVIVNGGNCPKTAAFLKNFSGKQISEKDYGISDAFNKGIQLSTGMAIVFLNSGDHLVDREYFKWAEKALEYVDFTYSDITFNDSLAGKLVIKPHRKPIGRGMPFPHQTMIVKKTVFDELGAFKLNYKRAMCFEFTCRLLKAKKIGSYYPHSTMLMDGGGISSTQEQKTLEESKMAMIENGVFDFKNSLYFSVRVSGFKFRKTLLAMNLDPLLKYLKIIKRKLT